MTTDAPAIPAAWLPEAAAAWLPFRIAQIQQLSRRKGLESTILSPELIAALTPHPREKIITGGQQGGKSYLGALEIVLSIAENQQKMLTGWLPDRPQLYWIILPNYKRANTEMEYLATMLEKFGRTRAHFPPNDSSRIELFNGKVVIETKTAMDIPAIAGEPCDGVLLSEAGSMEDGIRGQCIGRITTRRGWICYTGTIEPSEAQPKWMWYERLAKDWADTPSPGEKESYALPTWSNLSAFPGGRTDPEILRVEADHGVDSNWFKRRIMGIPTGISNPIYWQMEDSVDRAFRGVNPVWISALGAGGHDFGTGGRYNHPSTLVAITALNQIVRPLLENEKPHNILVAREAWSSLTQDQQEIEYHRRRLSAKYGIPRTRWGFDPIQKEAAQMADAQTAGGPGSRMAKVGMVEARLNRNTILFDPDGPGVYSGLGEDGSDGLVPQLRRVHFIERVLPGRGSVMEYDRTDDDLAAAFENAVAVIDGNQGFALPTGKGAKLRGMAVKRPVQRTPAYTRR